MSITVESATEALARVIDPNTGKDLVSTRSARNVRVDGTKVGLDVELGYPGASQIEPIRVGGRLKECLPIAQRETLPA